jgi:hypothetical protein
MGARRKPGASLKNGGGAADTSYEGAIARLQPATWETTDMSSTINMAEMPKTQASIRQNEMLMNYMQVSGEVRNAEQDAALAVATTRESLLENSLKGSLLQKTG